MEIIFKLAKEGHMALPSRGFETGGLPPSSVKNIVSISVGKTISVGHNMLGNGVNLFRIFP